MRKFLNLGHTFGHAVEYEHKIPHGHAVMIGILYQFIVANQMLHTEYDIQHFINYLQCLNYPLEIIPKLNFEDTYQFMLLDKKITVKVFKWSYFKIGVVLLYFMLIKRDTLKHLINYSHILGR